MAEYIALVHKEKRSAYGASFPDFPGCISAAGTLEDLRPMIEESLGLHIEGMLEDGEALPEPSTLDAIVKSKDYAGAVAVMVVKAPETQGATVRVNITLPEKALAQIDRKAAREGMSRSSFLAKAAERWQVDA
jgi:predicted RNase H-like HicB family nuclease